MAFTIFPPWLWWLLDNPVRRLLITPETLADRLALTPRSRVLEVGPGSGYFTVELARRLPQGHLTVLDVQPEMLTMVRHKVEAHGLRNVSFTVADAGAPLPFPAGNFDVAVLVTVLGEVRDPRTCLRALRTVLRPCGTLAVHEHVPDPDRIRFEELISMAENTPLVQDRFGLTPSFM